MWSGRRSTMRACDAPLGWRSTAAASRKLRYTDSRRLLRDRCPPNTHTRRRTQRGSIPLARIHCSTRPGARARGGVPLAFTLLTVGSGDNAVEQLLQSDMAAIGIRMEIRQRELASFLQEARARPPRFDALITGIPGD